MGAETNTLGVDCGRWRGRRKVRELDPSSRHRGWDQSKNVVAKDVPLTHQVDIQSFNLAQEALDLLNVGKRDRFPLQESINLLHELSRSCNDAS